MHILPEMNHPNGGGGEAYDADEDDATVDGRFAAAFDAGDDGSAGRSGAMAGSGSAAAHLPPGYCAAGYSVAGYFRAGLIANDSHGTAAGKNDYHQRAGRF